MPKHIQMGTGMFTPASSSTCSSSVNNGPDLINHRRQQSIVGDSSQASSASAPSSAATTAAGSYKMAMENIIDDYRCSRGEIQKSKLLPLALFCSDPSLEVTLP